MSGKHIAFCLLRLTTFRWYPAKRALPAMLTHGRYGPFGSIPSIYALRVDVYSPMFAASGSVVFPGPSVYLGFHILGCIRWLDVIRARRFSWLEWQHNYIYRWQHVDRNEASLDTCDVVNIQTKICMDLQGQILIQTYVVINVSYRKKQQQNVQVRILGFSNLKMEDPCALLWEWGRI